MANFEEVLPALRAGKKVRQKCRPRAVLTNESWNVQAVLADDWEVVDEPKRVAEYWVPVANLHSMTALRERHEIGKQPEGAILIPGTERTEESREAVPGSEREVME